MYITSCDYHNMQSGTASNERKICQKKNAKNISWCFFFTVISLLYKSYKIVISSFMALLAIFAVLLLPQDVILGHFLSELTYFKAMIARYIFKDLPFININQQGHKQLKTMWVFILRPGLMVMVMLNAMKIKYYKSSWREKIK